jgi:uncharacterized protein (TIGR03118 family)
MEIVMHRFASTLRLTLVPCAAAILYATAASAESGSYQQHNLVSDGFIAADHVDANLVNAWGIAFNPFGPAWVSDNGTSLSTLYDGDGNPLALVVQIPTPTAPNGGTPTGIVFNAATATTSFPVGGVAGKFLFATEDGIIAGWAGGTQATKVIDSSAGGAIYKGIALSANGSGQLLYATDFHNARVDVFDHAFAPVSLPAGAFADPQLPPGYAPFGIQAIGGDLYVTFALQVPGSDDEAHGNGLGFVDVFDPDGKLLHRVASHGSLNAPWGIAQAPAGFGRFSNALLIGNFGDGRINAYDPKNYTFMGQLRGSGGRPLQIDGLWGIAFGNGSANQPVNTLFFAAGPDDEEHGLYGRIDAVDGNDD